jgi:hypothetical protein
MKMKEEKPFINFCFIKRTGIKIWIRGEWKRVKGQCKDPDRSISGQKMFLIRYIFEKCSIRLQLLIMNNLSP